MSDRVGTVVAVRRGSCEVLDDAEVSRHCELAADIATVQRTAIAVGDRVRWVDRPDAEPQVVEVLPRTSLLARPDPMDPSIQRAIAANVDLVVIVLAAKRPSPRLRFVDRVMVAVERGGARPVLVINKLDLLRDKARARLEDELAPYRDIGLPIVFTSTHSGAGIPQLHQVLAGHTCTFLGPSGVGKSSLINALRGLDDSDDFEAVEVGDVRRGDGKGRHTTTFSALHVLPDGTRIIDTPGVRAFGLWDLSREELRHSFPEFDGLPCRYADCVHDAEPEADCAVKRAVAAGQIAAARFESYRRLLASLER